MTEELALMVLKRLMHTLRTVNGSVLPVWPDLTVIAGPVLSGYVAETISPGPAPNPVARETKHPEVSLLSLLWLVVVLVTVLQKKSV